ncbi:hypothetical protein DRO60_01535 [Candidatus Bathyarchaeota archaeon]|nr:MAG: hypothetical protein DRO60_01535 [Candidatus Bathyarchaeota archaeon]
MVLGTGLPKRIYKRLPRRLPRSLGFKIYALFFDGVDDYVEVPDDPSLRPSEVTVEALYYRPADVLDREQLIVANRDLDNRRGYNLFDSYGYLGFQTGDGSSWYNAYVENTELVDTWVLLHGIHTAGKNILYINGEKVAEADAPPVVYTEGIPLMIGREPVYMARFLLGQIALVRIYNRPLSQAEIRRNIIEYHNPVRDGLVLFLYDRIVGDTWYDESPYANNGTIYGAVRKELAMWELRASIL